MISVAELKERAEAAFKFVRMRRHYYRLTFKPTNSAAQQVLSDLSRFCRARESTFSTDPYKMALMQGRYEVWLRITQHLNLSDAKLFDLYSGSNIEVAELEGDE